MNSNTPTPEKPTGAPLPLPAVPADGKPARKKRSQAPVALVYFLTLMLCLVVFGFAGMKLMQSLSSTGDDASSVPTAQSAGISEANNRTMLFLMIDSGKVSNCAVIRSLPATGKLVVIPLSPATVCEGQTISNLYAAGGIISVRKSLETELGITTDKYMTVTGDAFDKVVKLTGGVLYTVTEELFYRDPITKESVAYPKGTKTALEGAQLRMIMNYPTFSDGAAANVKVTGTLLADWLNTVFQTAGLTDDDIDSVFNALYEQSDSNITTVEYKVAKVSINYLRNNAVRPAYCIIPTGTWSPAGTFTVSAVFKEMLGGFLNPAAATADSTQPAA
ncbi:MAG: LCP family protein [Oscillospiraceae bacterium]